MRKVTLTIILSLAMCTPALADSAATNGKAVSDAFGKACGAGDIPSVMALYDDDAIAVWPGQGEVAHGKAEIETMAKNLCKPGAAPLKLVSQESRAVDRDHIINIGRWEMPAPGPDGKPATLEIRTTELLHKSDGKWRYEIDHASIGTP